MRLLIYAMESSGASAFCYFMGQRPESIAIIDVWSEYLAPPIGAAVPAVAKVTCNLAFTPEDHIASFRPDATILFLRHPWTVYCSLRKYPYANLLGAISRKLAKFDGVLGSNAFDLVVTYEEFAGRQLDFAALGRLGWPCSSDNYSLSRSIADIVAFNRAQSAWLREHFRRGWGPGNYKAGPITPFAPAAAEDALSEAQILRLTPNLAGYYAAKQR